MLQEFLKSSTWALVNDAAQLPGKRRKAQGMDTLDNTRAALDMFEPLAWKALSKMWPSFCQNSDSDDS